MADGTRSKPMDEDKLSTFMRAMIEDAEDYAEELGDERIRMTHVYDGEPYGNEEEGRSQLVTREARDTVRMAMPSLMRIIFGTERVVEYRGNQPEDVQAGREATEYMNYTIHNDNEGFREFHSAFEDALVRRTGIFKVWWETSQIPRRTRHTGLTMDQIEVLAADDDITEVIAEPAGETPAWTGDDGMEHPAEAMMDAIVIRTEEQGKLRFEAVPPEEYIINRSARSRTTAKLVGHRRNVTISDLLELGYDPDVVWDLAGTDEELEDEADSRAVLDDQEDDDDGVSQDPSQREVIYAECWVRVDYDGDGIAELRKVCVGGSGYTILSNELADECMLVDLCPLPVAHQAIGRSLVELVEDIQKIKTMVLRNTMDSLASAIHPDTVAVEGQVNFDDLLNTEQGRIIRQKAPGMLEYKTQPFVGQEALAMLDHLDRMRESRTGLNQASQGLDADALQSTSNVAIDAAVQSAQAQIELIARTLIETGLKPLFKLMLKTSIENADRKRHLRISNSFMEVDPRSWNADMDVTTKTALGTGSTEQRMQQLNMLATKQELIIQTAGPDNPIAGIPEYRNTLAEIAKLGGIVDVESYLKDPTQPENQPKPQEPQPDPQLMLAQSEMEKTKADAEDKDRRYKLDVWKAIQEDDRKRDELTAKVMLDAGDKENSANATRIQQMLDRDRHTADTLIKLLQTSAQREANQQRAAQTQQQGQPTNGNR